MCFKKLQEIYKKYPIQICLIAIILPIIILVIGSMFFSDLFWDRFLWKYFWGPIEADATGETADGIKPGYNIISTVTYALFLTIFLFAIYKLLKKLKITVDIKFLFAVTPFIILGAVYRVLEDSGLFKKPLIYLFISPFIYFITAGITIFFLLLSIYAEKEFKKKGMKHGLIFLMGIVLFMDVGYISIFIFLDKYFIYLIHPFWMILVSNLMVVLRLFIYSRFKKEFDTNAVFFASGTIFLSLGFYYIGHWLFFGQWGDGTKGIHIQILFAVIILSIIATLILVTIASKLSVKHPTFGIFVLGMNVAIIYAHFLDAAATFIGIDYYGYYEKHVLPKYLISVFDTAAIMFLLKGIVIVLVIYLIDIAYKKELKEKETLVGLVKLFVFILGFAPGVRDMIRLAMGV